ncbi:hypothetical protein AALT_g5728 [Alternaria alternata]|nr:hypothetical protein AALT_g5728 [Alternaria alternata]
MYPGSRCAPEIVSLGVGSGSDTEVLEAPLRYLRLISYYFNDRLHGTSEFFIVPNSSPFLFRIFLKFLKTGNLYRLDSDETTGRRFSFGTLINIFEFAKDFEIDTLRNAALNEFFLRIVDNPDRLPYKYISDIYEATSSDSSLRSLIVDVIVYIGTKQEMKEWKDDLPKEFMMNCLTAANEDEIVPFSGDRSEVEVMEWLNEMKGKLCNLFHVHDLGPEPESRQMRPFVKNRKSRLGKRARRRQEEETAREDSDEEGEMDPERQKLADDDAAERMRYLMEPLPARASLHHSNSDTISPAYEHTTAHQHQLDYQKPLANMKIVLATLCLSIFTVMINAVAIPEENGSYTSLAARWSLDDLVLVNMTVYDPRFPGVTFTGDAKSVNQQMGHLKPGDFPDLFEPSEARSLAKWSTVGL